MQEERVLLTAELDAARAEVERLSEMWRCVEPRVELQAESQLAWSSLHLRQENQSTHRQAAWDGVSLQTLTTAGMPSEPLNQTWGSSSTDRPLSDRSPGTPSKLKEMTAELNAGRRVFEDRVEMLRAGPSVSRPASARHPGERELGSETCVNSEGCATELSTDLAIHVAEQGHPSASALARRARDADARAAALDRTLAALRVGDTQLCDGASLEAEVQHHAELLRTHHVGRLASVVQHAGGAD